jgi:hypothetical protein
MATWPHTVTFGRDWWRRKGSGPVIGVDSAVRHAHYCGECDSQWPHPGKSVDCILHWATKCPECRMQPTRLGERQARTA